MTAEHFHLTIFHTNDLHGRLEAIARLSNFARRQRAASGDQTVFFFDAGDAADRRIRICSLTKGAAFMPLMNTMEYDLMTLGNDISLPYGPQAVAGLRARSKFPILAANLRDGAGPLVPGLDEQARFCLPGGLTMGVIGVTAPWGNLYEMFGLHLPDPIPLVQSLVDDMRQDGVELVVLLSHLGLEEDRRLLDHVHGIDLVIGGHSHSVLPEGEEYNGALIVQAGEYGRYLGRVELAIEERSGRVLHRTARLLEVPAGEPADPLVSEAIAAAEAEVDALMARPAGTLQTALEVDHFRECGLGNLAADALCARMGAECALLAGGQLRAGLPAGQITLGMLNEATFSSANPGLTEVRGEQILAALEHGLKPAVNRNEPHGFRGTPYGSPQIAGMQVWFSHKAKDGRRVQKVLVRGEPLEPDRIYRLAHTDAETFREGILKLDEGQETNFEVPTILVEVLEDYIRQHSPVPAPEGGRWIAVG